MKIETWIYEEPRTLDLNDWIAFRDEMDKEIKYHPKREDAFSSLRAANAMIESLQNDQSKQAA